MRYIVQFFDRSTKRIPAEAARQFMAAMHDGGNVLYRGQMYSGKSIAAVKTLFGFYQEKLSDATSKGRYFCKYGIEHENRPDCGCKDARIEKWFTPEELPLLKSWNEDREGIALGVLTQTHVQ